MRSSPLAPALAPALVALLLLALAPAARADPPGLWPAFRHDARRTGRADGRALLGTNPAVAWRIPVGGNLANGQSTLADVDADGRTDIVLASGGSVVVRHSDNSELGRSAPLGVTAVYGAFDLDGARPLEVLARSRSPRSVVAVNPLTGAVVWRVATNDDSPGAMPVPRAGGVDVLVRDYDGADTILTLYRTSMLAGGTAPTIWQVRMPGYDVQRSTTLADLTGDGTPEVVVPTARGFSIRALADGAQVTAVDVLPMPGDTPVYYFAYVTQNIDGRPGDEIVALDTSYYYSEDASLTVLGMSSASPPALQVRWQRYLRNDTTPGVGNDVGRRFIRMGGDCVGDLDHDGTSEIVFSQWDAAGTPERWTTFVLDAVTGTELARRIASTVEAVADLDHDDRLEVVLRNATDASPLANAPTPLFATLRAFDFDSRAAGLVDKGWSLMNAAVVTVPAYQQRRTPFELGAATSSYFNVGAHQDIDAPGASDPADELYVYYDEADEFVNQQRPTHIEAVHGADGMIRARFAIPPAAFATVAQLGAAIASPTARAEALVAVNDGRARVISNTFTQVGAVDEGNYARLPSVVSLDGASSVIAAVDSTEILALLDGTRFTGTSPVARNRVRAVEQPESRGYVNQPGVVLPQPASGDAGAGAGSLLVVRAHSMRDYQDQALVALDAAGMERWRAEVGAGRSIAGFDNAVAADFTADGVPDLFLTELDSNGTEQLVVRDGRNGTMVRSVPVGPMLSASGESVTVGAYFQGYAAHDVNGDGVPDIVGALHPQWFAAINVASGSIAPLWVYRSAADPIVNGQAMVGPLAADGSLRVLRVNSQNAYGPYVRFALSGAVEAAVDPPGVQPARDQVDQNNAAFVQRTGGGAPRFDFVTAGMAGNATGTLVRFDGATMMPTFTKHLSGGMVTDTAPASRYALYDPIAVDIDGDGADDVAVGSDDGRLYALNGATGALLFALDLRSPVVHVIAANIDQDPELELVCAMADGTLAAVDGAGRYRWQEQPGGAPDGGVMGDGGGSDGGGTMTDAAGAGDAGMDARAGSDAGSGGGGGGCGCRAAGGASGGAPRRVWIVLVCALAGAALVGRRRGRRLEPGG